MNRAPWVFTAVATLALAAHGCGEKGGTTGSSSGSGAAGTGGGGVGGAVPILHAACGVPVQPPSHFTCYEGGVGPVDGGPALCDPFSGKDCDVDGGETCDIDLDGFFHCFPPPNDAPLCGACGVDPGDGGTPQYCGVGLTCLDSNLCAAFCCSDADCGDGGRCNERFIGDPKVGVCTK